jgi:phosphoribosyl-AMP cyclohydrolase
MNWLDEVKWDAQGLVPVIAQEAGSNDVLMFAFMNREALLETATGGVFQPVQAAFVAQGRRVWSHPNRA